MEPFDVYPGDHQSYILVATVPDLEEKLPGICFCCGNEKLPLSVYLRPVTARTQQDKQEERKYVRAYLA